MKALAGLRQAFGLLAPEERREAIVLVILLGIAAIAELASVAAIYPFLAVLANPSLVRTDARISWLYSLAGSPDPRTFMIELGAGAFALMLIANLLSGGALWAQVRFVWRANHSISERLLARHLARPYTDFLANNSSIYAKQILEETQTLVVNTLDPAFIVAGRLAVIVLIGALLLLVSPFVTAAFFVLVGGGFGLVYFRLREGLKESGAESVAANSSRFQSVAETFGAIKQVKVGGLEQLFHERYLPYSLAYSRGQSTHNVVRRVPYYLMQTVAFGGVTLLLIALLVLGYDLGYILPLVGVLAVGGFRLLPAFQQVLAAAVAFRFTEPILRGIEAELAAPRSGAAEAEADRRPRILPAREVALEGVGFTYPAQSKPTLVDIDLTIPAHSSVAFVGATGAGKSTLVDILMGLLPPSRGRVVIDGEPLTADRIPDWQRSLGYVPQDIYLTDDTIEANIAFGVSNDLVDRGAVERAARTAQIHDFIASDLPAGYATRVGERGVRLSGGQRQRIGIARALYHDPPVLVLDEATSDIDNRTERDIARALDALSGAKTLIMIAHRLATAQRCDRIYQLDRGRVTAAGTYDELMRTSPEFRALAGMTPEVAPVQSDQVAPTPPPRR